MSNDTIQRRLYFRQMARDELAGADSLSALDIARRAAQSGEPRQGHDVPVRGPSLGEASGSDELARLRRHPRAGRISPVRHLSAVNQQLAERINLSRGLHEPRMKQMLGVVDPEVQSGRKEEPGLDIQGMTTLSGNIESLTADLLNKTVANECVDPPAKAEVAHEEGAFDSRTVS